MKNLMKKFRLRRHYLVVDEVNLVEVLGIITNATTWFINQELKVDNGVLVRMKYDAKCSVDFTTSDMKWSSIISELKDKGFKLVVDDYDIIVVTKD